MGCLKYFPIYKFRWIWAIRLDLFQDHLSQMIADLHLTNSGAGDISTNARNDFFPLVEGALCTIAHCELGSVVRQIIAFYPALLEPRPPGLLLALTMPTLTSTLALAPHAHLQLGGPTSWPKPPPLHLVVCLHLWRPPMWQRIKDVWCADFTYNPFPS